MKVDTNFPICGTPCYATRPNHLRGGLAYGAPDTHPTGCARGEGQGGGDIAYSIKRGESQLATAITAVLDLQNNSEALMMVCCTQLLKRQLKVNPFLCVK